MPCGQRKTNLLAFRNALERQGHTTYEDFLSRLRLYQRLGQDVEIVVHAEHEDVLCVCQVQDADGGDSALEAPTSLEVEECSGVEDLDGMSDARDRFGRQRE